MDNDCLCTNMYVRTVCTVCRLCTVPRVLNGDSLVSSLVWVGIIKTDCTVPKVALEDAAILESIIVQIKGQTATIRLLLPYRAPCVVNAQGFGPISFRTILNTGYPNTE